MCTVRLCISCCLLASDLWLVDCGFGVFGSFRGFAFMLDRVFCTFVDLQYGFFRLKRLGLALGVLSWYSVAWVLLG